MMEKRSKLKDGKKLGLRDEQIELDNGSGLAGSISQPRRPT